jgi:L-ribulose-5-phosphate 3-epimerase
MDRRQFLKTAFAAAGGLGLSQLPLRLRAAGPAAASAAAPPFRISLAEWSLVQSLQSGRLDNLAFPAYAKKEFGIEAVEYVDQFFKDKAKDQAYLKDLKKRCEDAGVRSNLIMIDTPGALADADEAARKRAVEGHKQWVDAARFLGCHSIRVNAWGKGTPEEMGKRFTESASALVEYATQAGLNVIVENHGGCSSDPAWLTGVIRQVGSPYFGTLPDFGNFPEGADRYGAVERLMPFARGVSSKGDAVSIPKMLRIVLDAGYRGWVGIEYEGSRLTEFEGIHAAERCLGRIVRAYS